MEDVPGEPWVTLYAGEVGTVVGRNERIANSYHVRFEVRRSTLFSKMGKRAPGSGRSIVVPVTSWYLEPV